MKSSALKFLSTVGFLLVFCACSKQGTTPSPSDRPPALGTSVVTEKIGGGRTSTSTGPGSSGGGASVVCLGTDRKVVSAHLLDLYEAEIRFGLTIPQSQDSADAQINQIQARLAQWNPYIGQDFVDLLIKFKTQVNFLPAGVTMPGVSDLGSHFPAVIPEGCELQYAGFYESDGTLRISKTVFDKFTPTDQAAFFVHEVLYGLARLYYEAHDSEEARKMVGFLFAPTSD
ncbi:hypothetical protein WDW37_05335 [Bdellovibrionota bacterium FG-1]